MADRGRPKRICGDCGAALSIYSDDDRCAPCQRSFLDLYRRLPPIPAQVWADREVRDALAIWDFGTVARLVRQRSGLRQETIAELTGLSQGFLSQLESGRSQLVNIHKIIGFLDGLGTPTDLCPRPTTRQRRRTEAVETHGIGDRLVSSDLAVQHVEEQEEEEDVDRRDFLQGAVVAAAGALAAATGVPAADASAVPDLVSLERAVDRATRLERASQYAAVEAVLPRLVRDVEDVARDVPVGRECDAGSLLSRAYAVRAWVLIKRNEATQAEVAASGSLRAATSVDDVLLAAAAMRCLGEAHMRAGRLGVACDLAVEAGEMVTRSLDASEEAQVMRGAAYLSAAMAHARAGDRAAAEELIDAASANAARLGHDRSGVAVFGPSNVDIHRVAAAIDLGDPATALEHAERTQPQLPAGFEERAARYLIDCARAYAAHRRDDDALHALLDAEEAAPEEVRTHPLTTSVVVELLGREQRARTPGLRALASRSGALEMA